MNEEAHKLFFTLIYKGEEYRVQTFSHQYYSLMTLISDYLAISGFCICSGMGSCGTCLVDISMNNSSSVKTSLACEVQLNDDLSNVTITIPGHFS